MSSKSVASPLDDPDVGPRYKTRSTMQPPSSSSSGAPDHDPKPRNDSTMQPRCVSPSKASSADTDHQSAANTEPEEGPLLRGIDLDSGAKARESSRTPGTPQCKTCGSTSHTPNDECGPTAANIASRSERLSRLEPFARYALHRGIPPNAPICVDHRQRGLHNTPVGDLVDPAHPAAILQDRALMPMCGKCAHLRFKEMKKHTAFDVCVCAAEVFDDKDCLWCALERLNRRRDDYIEGHRKTIYVAEMKGEPEVPHRFIACACGARPMTMSEALRLCACCNGAVTVPLHALDGVTHLVCPYGEVSRRIIGEEGGDLDRVLTGMATECIAHPVPQFIPLAARQLERMSRRKREQLAQAERRSSGGGQGPESEAESSGKASGASEKSA